MFVIFLLYIVIFTTLLHALPSHEQRGAPESHSKKRLLSLEEKADSSDPSFPVSGFPTNLDADPSTVAVSPAAAVPFSAMMGRPKRDRSRSSARSERRTQARPEEKAAPYNAAAPKRTPEPPNDSGALLDGRPIRLGRRLRPRASFPS